LRILLDTNVLIRLGGTSAPASNSILARVTSSDELFVTSISRAEIAIKLSIGKLVLPAAESAFWRGLVTELQATEIPFTSSHAELLTSMPLHHRDPFDRMIIAQCLAEDFCIATTDSIFGLYGVRTLM